MDAHLVTIPCLGTFTIWRLTCGDTKGLGWHADGALDLQVLVLGGLDQLVGDALNGRAVLGGDGDADFVLLKNLKFSFS